MSQVEITDVERLTLRPGDALVVRTPNRINRQIAVIIAERVREILKLDPGFPVLVLDEGASIEVVERPAAP